MSDLFRAYVDDVQRGEYHPKWVRANPREAEKWAAFRDGLLAGEQPAAPVLATWYGRALVHAGELEMLRGSGAGDRDPVAAPTVTAAPTITGITNVGSTLTASVGTWTGSPTAYSYRWQRASLAGTYTDIPGGTGSVYAPVSADVGFTIRVVVGAQNAGGETFATSAETGQVTATSGGSAFGASLPARIPESSGTNYYVATTGSDSNDGSSSSPWLTIQKALDTVPLTGSIINVRTGSYVDANNQLEWTRTGSSTNPVTLQSYPGELAVINQTRLRITGDYFRVRNMKIQNPVFAVQDCMKIEGGAHHIDVDGMELTGAMWQGILMGAAGDTVTDIQVWNTRIHGWVAGGGAGDGHDHGIYFANVRRCVVANCLIYDNQNGFGLHVYPDVDDLIVTGCTVDDHMNSTGSGGGSVIIFEGTAISNVRVYASLLTRQASSMPAVNTGGSISSSSVNDCLGFQGASPMFEPNAGVTYTHCVTGNPLYVDADGRDYELQSSSPAIGLPQSSRDAFLPGTYRDGTPRLARVAGSEPPA